MHLSIFNSKWNTHNCESSSSYKSSSSSSFVFFLSIFFVWWARLVSFPLFHRLMSVSCFVWLLNRTICYTFLSFVVVSSLLRPDFLAIFFSVISAVSWCACVRDFTCGPSMRCDDCNGEGKNIRRNKSEHALKSSRIALNVLSFFSATRNPRGR